jgi:hypothetical protein
VPDHRPLFSSPGATTAPSTAVRAASGRPSRPATVDIGLNVAGEPRRQANPGDEVTVDPVDRRRRARAALLDLRRDVIRRSAGY